MPASFYFTARNLAYYKHINTHLPVFISSPKAPEMRFNWFSSIFGLAFLWGLAAYCMANPAAANAKLGSWLSVVTKVISHNVAL